MKFVDDTVVFEGPKELAALLEIMNEAIPAYADKAGLSSSELLAHGHPLDLDATRLIQIAYPKLEERLEKLSVLYPF